MRVMRPFAIVEVTMLPWRRPGALNSAAYFAAPVTFATPSTRDVAVAVDGGMGFLDGACLTATTAAGHALHSLACGPYRRHRRRSLKVFACYPLQRRADRLRL